MLAPPPDRPPGPPPQGAPPPDRLPGPSPQAAGRRRAAWGIAWRTALVAAAGAVSLAVNWQRWINPFVDSGREMNVPARLAAGERLYRDIVFYYGPAGPWLQALALRLGNGRPSAAPAAGGSWLPLELACLALSAAILVLLYRLSSAAGGARSALAGTALAALFCIGAPHGGAFIFPYSASSLYALAGALLALDASRQQASWRRRALVAAGLGLALAARFEIGAAATILLLIAALRYRPDGAPAPGAPPLPAAPAGERPSTAVGAPATRQAPLRPALADLAAGIAVAVAVYTAAFAGVPWRLLLGQGPLTHMLAMPTEWKGFYGSVSGLAHPARSLAELALGLGLDALALAACAWSFRKRPRELAVASAVRRLDPGDSPSASVIHESDRAPGPAGAGADPDLRHGALRRGHPSHDGRAGAVHRVLARLLFGVAVAVAVAAFARWGGPRRWPWGRLSDALPPLLFPLPVLAAAAALGALRRPLDERGRARFLLFALAAALATRVVLGLEIGPEMTAYCAMPLALLLPAAAVLASDVLAPRLPDPGGFRFRLAAMAAGLTVLHLLRVGTLAYGPHIVRLDTPAGSLRLTWKEAYALEGTLGYLAAHARPGDTLASFPEAGFVNFVTGLPNPMREEEVFPGVLGSGREAEAIARLLAARPRFVLLANRPTREFGARAFGEDYATALWSAVEDHYSLAASFGNAPEGAPIGGRRFFIRVYETGGAPTGPAPNTSRLPRTSQLSVSRRRRASA
jgi:hypothetical protein